MRNLIVRICRGLLAAMGLSGAVSCDGLFETRVEYGTPHCNYEVKCKVVDSETAKPVKGLSASPGIVYSYTDENGAKDFYEFGKPVESTDGDFLLTGVNYHGNYEEIHIKLRDIDPAADGHYKDSLYVIPLKKIKDAPKDSHWNSGTYGADVTIEAELIKEK